MSFDSTPWYEYEMQKFWPGRAYATERQFALESLGA